MKGSICPPCFFFPFFFSFSPTSDKRKMKRLFATFPAVFGALLIVIVDDASQMFAAGAAQGSNSGNTTVNYCFHYCLLCRVLQIMAE